MINLFAAGLNQMIGFAQQMQRLESEMLRMYLNGLSMATERVGSLSEMGGQTFRQAEEDVAGLTRAVASAARTGRTATRQTSHARAKASTAKAQHRAQPRRRRR